LLQQKKYLFFGRNKGETLKFVGGVSVGGVSASNLSAVCRRLVFFGVFLGGFYKNISIENFCRRRVGVQFVGGLSACGNCDTDKLPTNCTPTRRRQIVRRHAADRHVADKP